MILYDYRCESCDSITESLEHRETERIDCPVCEGSAVRIISGTHTATVWGYAAVRGENQPPPPGAMDTRSLAEGESYKSWRKRRTKERQEARRRSNGYQPKVYVG